MALSSFSRGSTGRSDCVQASSSCKVLLRTLIFNCSKCVARRMTIASKLLRDEVNLTRRSRRHRLMPTHAGHEDRRLPRLSLIKVRTCPKSSFCSNATVLRELLHRLIFWPDFTICSSCTRLEPKAASTHCPRSVESSEASVDRSAVGDPMLSELLGIAHPRLLLPAPSHMDNSDCR